MYCNIRTVTLVINPTRKDLSMARPKKEVTIEELQTRIKDFDCALLESVKKVRDYQIELQAAKSTEASLAEKVQLLEKISKASDARERATAQELQRARNQLDILKRAIHILTGV